MERSLPLGHVGPNIHERTRNINSLFAGCFVAVGLVEVSAFLFEEIARPEMMLSDTFELLMG